MDATPGSISLSFSAVADTNQNAVTDYIYQKSTNGGSAWSGVTSLGIDNADNPVTVAGLTEATEYVFHVAGVNTAGTHRHTDTHC